MRRQDQAGSGPAWKKEVHCIVTQAVSKSGGADQSSRVSRVSTPHGKRKKTGRCPLWVRQKADLARRQGKSRKGQPKGPVGERAAEKENRQGGPGESKKKGVSLADGTWGPPTTALKPLSSNQPTIESAGRGGYCTTDSRGKSIKRTNSYMERKKCV